MLHPGYRVWDTRQNPDKLKRLGKYMCCFTHYCLEISDYFVFCYVIRLSHLICFLLCLFSISLIQIIGQNDKLKTLGKYLWVASPMIVLKIMPLSCFIWGNILSGLWSHIQCYCDISAELQNVICKSNTVKPVLSGHSKRRPKIGFQDRLLLNAGQKYCRMLQESILQYFWPPLSYHLSLRPLFWLFLSGRLRKVSLYWQYTSSNGNFEYGYPHFNAPLHLFTITNIVS